MGTVFPGGDKLRDAGVQVLPVGARKFPQTAWSFSFPFLALTP